MIKVLAPLLFLPLFDLAQSDPFISHGVSGLYEASFNHIDVHPDNSVDFDGGGGGCGPSTFYDKGTCVVKNDSLITIIYRMDSVRITYKMLPGLGIAEEGSQDTIVIHLRKGTAQTYIYYKFVWKKTVGYYQDGSKRWEVNDNSKVTNTINGPYIGYFQSGQISEKGTIKNSKREGKWMYFNNAGKKTKVARYSKGILKKEGVL